MTLCVSLSVHVHVYNIYMCIYIPGVYYVHNYVCVFEYHYINMQIIYFCLHVQLARQGLNVVIISRSKEKLLVVADEISK